MLDMSPWLCLESPEAGGHTDREAHEDAGSALREFLVANYGRLHRRLLRHLGDADLASDSLHDAWLRLGDMAAPAVQNPEAYVYRTACNVAVDCLRRNRPQPHVEDGEALFEFLVDRAPGPESIAEARSDVHAVDRAMQHLPRRHRAVLVALRLEEKTRQEVADRHQISLRSVDTALRQALAHCAQATGQTVHAGIELRATTAPAPRKTRRQAGPNSAAAQPAARHCRA
ncbi:RNA polymerase sigma factor [Variovorax sp.]|jgi:RNA polymerase sigma factor (sigma-70 family)|uniref:RNA polymerase sigma factor n=1 Tax=Variovorax sp. TaxID=1871043 RepID=UPI001219EB0F|nr:sigma-70 family RNA polymerase sigma factor [Variovorax sp.]TAJ58129.1 MAG: sigma-70 family RNA polymerase sigma factor [Variovorax sp.]